jgi:glutamine synthetase
MPVPILPFVTRLVPGYEAPVYVAWSGRNRSPLIRVPESRGLSTRLELRSVDPSANPYLAMAALLQAGLDGIKQELTPTPAVNSNIYVMNEDERAAAKISDLPSTLHNALKELRKDDVIKDALGDHIFNNFLVSKRFEWDAYKQSVSEWEREQYLELY